MVLAIDPGLIVLRFLDEYDQRELAAILGYDGIRDFLTPYSHRCMITWLLVNDSHTLVCKACRYSIYEDRFSDK